jgi:zinc protease
VDKMNASSRNIPIISDTLSNGLQIRMKVMRSAPIISQWLWLRVGSRLEPPGKKGISHWVEHMQFKGTPRHPSTVMEKAVAREGGIWNAFTFLDWTTYFETLPADKIGLAMELEADRIRNSLFDAREVEAERTVILSELEGNENEPMFRLNRAVQEASFKSHPYHYETIGSKTDLLAITREDLFHHYRKYYSPGNSLLALAGDFDPDDMLARIQKLYQEMPGSEVVIAPLPEEPPLSREERLEVRGPGEAVFLQIAYRAPRASDPDFFAFTVLDSLLTGPTSLNMFGGGGISNKTSRLYRRLVEKSLAVGVGGGLQATIDPFLHETIITAHPKARIEMILEAFDEEIMKLQDKMITQKEIDRAAKQARALFAYSYENITNQGFWLGFSEMIANNDWFLQYVERLEEIRPVDVQEIARKYLNRDHRVVGIYLPVQNEGER